MGPPGELKTIESTRFLRRLGAVCGDAGRPGVPLSRSFLQRASEREMSDDGL